MELRFYAWLSLYILIFLYSFAHQVLFILFTLRLTAFVMRVFCEAQQFDGVNIDEEMVCRSVGWLTNNQRGDGALPEVHAVIHKEMVVSCFLPLHNHAIGERYTTPLESIARQSKD